MVRLKGYLYPHLQGERGRRKVVMRVRVYEHFRLGATDVIEAPHEDMKKSYKCFASAAAAVHKALYGSADSRPENIYWTDYVAYIRHSLPRCGDSNRSHNPAGDGPFNRSQRRGTLPCRFFIEGVTFYTYASPELADLEVESLRSSDGSGEWVRVGHLRPFVPPGVGLAAIPWLVKRAIQNKEHHQRRSYSVRKRLRPEREQDYDDDDVEEEGQVPEVELYGDNMFGDGARALGLPQLSPPRPRLALPSPSTAADVSTTSFASLTRSRLVVRSRAGAAAPSSLPPRGEGAAKAREADVTCSTLPAAPPHGGRVRAGGGREAVLLHDHRRDALGGGGTGRLHLFPCRRRRRHSLCGPSVRPPVGALSS